MPPTTKYNYPYRSTFEDTSLAGNVYFANFLRWQGKCRESFLQEKVPELVKDIAEGRLALITLHCSCNYFSEVYAFDLITIGMSLESIQQHKIRMHFEYTKMEDGKQKIAASGTHEIGCYQRTAKGLEPVAVPDALYTALQEYMES